jgi:hypothetical protein
VVVIEPENQDDKQNVAGAKFFHELLNIRLKRSIPWFLTLQGAYQDVQAVGICISYQYWDYARRKIDEPCVDLCPIENFRFSPGADWRNVVKTSPYLIQLIPMYVKDVKARMKARDPTALPKWKTVPDERSAEGRAGYSDSIRLLRDQRPRRTPPHRSPRPINDFSLVWVHRNVAEVDGEDYVYYTLGDSVLLRSQEAEGRVPPRLRPYVIGTCVLETHKVYPSGVSRLGRATQEEINDNANQRGDNVRFAMNKRYFGRRGAQVDTRSMTRNVPGSVTLMNDVEKDIKVLETKDVTASAFQEQDRLNVDFDEIAGTFGQSSVQGNKTLSDKVGGMEILTARTRTSSATTS